MASSPSTDVTPKRLTDYADCAGCASKFDAADLEQLMGDLPANTDPRVLVDYRTADDAGVFVWNGSQALVQTVDFFTPVVDDPYVFGQIAAANALSDVYAMGGTPRTALAITALPKKGPSTETVRAIFRGGLDTLTAAGVVLLGGHTVSDPEVKFGYAVTGEVQVDRLLTNAKARPGDRILLTKPLGTGVVVRARKYGEGTDVELAAAVRSMIQLNDRAAQAASAMPHDAIGACTDVTGFGLAGHASEVAAASGATLVFDTEALPVLPGAERLVSKFLPCGGRANIRHFRYLEVADGVRPERHLLTLDPQTSGGLLITIAPAAVETFMGHMAQHNLEAWLVGEVEPKALNGTLVRLR